MARPADLEARARANRDLATRARLLANASPSDRTKTLLNTYAAELEQRADAAVAEAQSDQPSLPDEAQPPHGRYGQR